MSGSIEKLGGTLVERMRQTVNASVYPALALGTINANLSLSVDGLETPVPKGQYLLSLTLGGGSYETGIASHTHDGGEHRHTDAYGGATSSATHSHGGGEHRHRLPAFFRGLQAGDRVLLAWVGNEPVVITVVASS